MGEPWAMWPLSETKTVAEDVLVSGEYRYFRDGQAMPVREYWQRLSSPSGSFWRSFRYVPEMELQLRVEYWPDSHCQLQWLEPELTLSQRYVCEQGQWHCQSQAERSDSNESVLKASVFHPLMRVFTAETLLKVLASSGNCTILLPDIRPQTPPEQRLQPQLSERQVIALGPKPMPAVADIAGAELAAYHYLGEQYGSEGDACFYMDASAEPLLAGYDWQAADGLWQVRLVRDA